MVIEQGAGSVDGSFNVGQYQFLYLPVNSCLQGPIVLLFERHDALHGLYLEVLC